MPETAKHCAATRPPSPSSRQVKNIRAPAPESARPLVTDSFRPAARHIRRQWRVDFGRGPA
jgi:hypothetical protein